MLRKVQGVVKDMPRIRTPGLGAKRDSASEPAFAGSAAARFFCTITLIALATLCTTPACSEENSANSPSLVRNADVIDAVGACAARGEEAVLSAAANPNCVPYGTGSKELSRQSPKMAYQVDASQACRDQTNKSVLDAHAIKIIAADASKKVGPAGIRIVGAIFCDPLDLVGLSLTYSLMMDHSIFVMGIEARNFQTTGDLSFDGALIFGELSLFRSKIGGTVFGRDTLIQNPQFLDTEVRGALLLRDSVLLEPVMFDTTTVTGELSLRQSIFPYFLLQFSTVGSVLDLSYTQARCAYQIRKDEIGDLVAVGAGFTSSSLSLAEGNAETDLSDLFNAGRMNTDIPESKTQRSVKDAFEDRNCKYNLIAAPSVFAVSDTVVRQRLCLQTFRWPTGQSDSQSNQQESYLTLNDITVDASAFIDLTQGDGSSVSDAKGGIRRFEMLGFRTRSLIYNFGNASEPPSYTNSYLNGLQFEQVYSARLASGAVKCGYDPENTKETKAEYVINSIDSLKSPLPAPTVADVMSLLNSNAGRSTQPFAAFVDVFQKNGEDNKAKQLRIEKADIELLLNTNRVIGRNAGEDPETASIPLLQSHFEWAWNSIRGMMTFISDLVRLFFGYVLWLLADNGYRPEKVGWFVSIVIILSFVYFWFWIRIIAIKPEKKPTPLPIGLTFLFDRLLPAYQIRADHYNIEAYLERVKKSHPHGEDFTYMKMTFRVAKADAKTVQRAERTLDILKFVGLILAVFLVAALNSLVSR
jgi:hypothetical protein